jgi:hypothetical protein
MSLRFLHQVIIFAAIAICLVFAAWCFTDPSVVGDIRFLVAGVLSIAAIFALIAYEIYFLRKTRRLILS